MKTYTDIKDLQLIGITALESSLAGFWDWNMVTNEEYLSPRFKEMFGYEPHEMENTPEAWHAIAYAEDLPAMFKDFNKHIESKGEIPFNAILRYHHKNGQTIWVRCYGKVVEWSTEGKPLRAIGCHVDITSEKETELQLKKAIQDKELLLKEVHHRVKNNLQLIHSLSQLKQKKNKVDLHEIKDTINVISAAHEAVYKAEKNDNMELGTYLEQIITPLLSRQNIQFEISADKISEDINLLIPIGLIVLECTNNSLKHGFTTAIQQKQITLHVTSAKDAIVITYKDNGVGYPSAILQKSAQLNSYGLKIIHALAQQVNGEIKLSNNQGAQMKLTIDLSNQ